MMTFDVYLKDIMVAKYECGTRVATIAEQAIVNLLCQDSAKEFLTSRVSPKSTWCDFHRELYKLDEWDPYAICRKTHGHKKSDPLWIKFPDDPEDLNWEMVKLQIW